MRIHLIPDNTLDQDLYVRVLSLLQAVPGVNKFYASGGGEILIPDDMREQQEIDTKENFESQVYSYSPSSEEPRLSKSMQRRTWSFPHFRLAARWRDFFGQIRLFRQRKAIPEKEFLILLTPIANQQNWFATLDESDPYNGFVHTDEWEHFMDCDPALPIAFEVMALALQKNIFKDFEEVRALTHERPIGCVSDLCMKKSDIILKMRTADICPACMERVQRNLSMPEIHHALSILESLRVKMLFAQNFRQNSPPSKLVIRRGGRIYLPDYGNIEIRMPAMEKALYLLFLRYPEGLYLSSITEEYLNELSEIYILVSTRGLREDMRARIRELNQALRISVQISRIKRAFTDAIGASLADHYIIQGENAEKKKIKLSRELVENSIG
ncbi:MAG: hypothetical protein VKL41_21910 [Snowella sp.]|nr:hypothetical protein [Snowella sp.]